MGLRVERGPHVLLLFTVSGMTAITIPHTYLGELLCYIGLCVLSSAYMLYECHVNHGFMRETTPVTDNSYLYNETSISSATPIKPGARVFTSEDRRMLLLAGTFAAAILFCAGGAYIITSTLTRFLILLALVQAAQVLSASLAVVRYH